LQPKNIIDIQSLIEKGESQTIEFKRSTATLKGAAETLCEFLNKKSGSVVISIGNQEKSR